MLGFSGEEGIVRNFVVGLCCLVLAGMMAAANAADLPEIKQRGKLVAATSGDLVPVTYVNEKGQLEGYDIEVAHFIEKKLAVPIDLVRLDFKGILAGLQAGRFDAVFSNVNITDERKKVFDYSIPYSRSAVVAVVRKGLDNVHGYKDLKGLTVGGISGGNDGEVPLLFLDVVDSPMNAFFSTGFSGLHDDAQQSVTRPAGDSLARFGAGLLPIEPQTPYGLASPVFNYPYKRTRASLAAIERASRPDPHWGHTLRFSNPLNGGWATPTIANWVSRLPSDFTTAPLRSTDALIVAVAEGSCTAQAGDQRLDLGPGDVLVVPNWCWRHFSAGPDGCVLFVSSDRAAQERLDLWREERRPQ